MWYIPRCFDWHLETVTRVWNSGMTPSSFVGHARSSVVLAAAVGAGGLAEVPLPCAAALADLERVLAASIVFSFIPVFPRALLYAMQSRCAPRILSTKAIGTFHRNWPQMLKKAQISVKAARSATEASAAASGPR